MSYDCCPTGICWNDLLSFQDLYPTFDKFEQFILAETEVDPLFDLEVFYNRFKAVNEWDRLKHTSIYGFNRDFADLWNENIYEWNREFELLSQDYDFESGIVVTSTSTGQIVINATAQQDSFAKPQFDDIEKNITGRNKGDTDSTQDNTGSGSSETKQKQTNIQINEYMKAYARFVYTRVVKRFDKLFLNIIG